MYVEIFNGVNLFSRFYIDYNKKAVDIETQPDRAIKNISDIFTYPGKGFVFDFYTISIFLKNRRIFPDTKEGLYTNIDDDIKIVVIK